MLTPYGILSQLRAQGVVLEVMRDGLNGVNSRMGSSAEEHDDFLLDAAITLTDMIVDLAGNIADSLTDLDRIGVMEELAAHCWVMPVVEIVVPEEAE